MALKTKLVLENAKKIGFISEKDIQLLKNRKNHGENISNDVFYENNILVQGTQADKGLAWLRNLCKTPIGRERKNNPFTESQEKILFGENPYFYFRGFEDMGRYTSHYQQIYQLITDEGNFTYINCWGCETPVKVIDTELK